MQIEETFRVEVPVDEAWRILLDLERIAGCVPGAELQEISGDEHHGLLKVKIGPIKARYQGIAKLESVDEATHTAILVANGRDTKGQGDVSATLSITLLPEGAGTRVDIDTDLSFSGKVAQFGRGVMTDVAAKLLVQLLENLDRSVLRGDVVDLTEPEPGEEPDALDDLDEILDDVSDEIPDNLPDDIPDELVADAVAAEAEPAAAPSGNGAAVRKSPGEAPAPAPSLEPGGSPVLRRVAPLAGFVLIGVLLRYLVRRRRR